MSYQFQFVAEVSPKEDVRSAVPVRSRRWIKIVLALSILIVGGEIVSRAFWRMYNGTSFFSSTPILYSIYPSFRTTGVEDVAIRNNDEVFDVLLLGGSALHRDYGTIEPQLQEKLARRLGKEVRVYNLAFPAHNTRDSLIKHHRLAGQRFDLIAIYDGINDARMNNIPEGEFRDDYSHCRWYDDVNFIERHPALNRLALPFTLRFAAGRVMEVTGWRGYASRQKPSAKASELGKNIRTKKTFKNNIEEIVIAARARGEKVVLMTYAYHVPEGFSLEGEVDGHPDFASGHSAYATWGKPKYVTQAIDQHNEAVTELAAKYPGTLLVDQRARMTRAGTHFYDCCHLTATGCAQFVDNMLDVILAPGAMGGVSAQP